MLIENALVFRPDGKFQRGNVSFNERFGSSPDGEKINAEGMYLLPGFVDIHIHGAMNSDACDASHEALETVSDYLLSNGVTSFCATTMTYDRETLLKIMSSIKDFESKNGAKCLGINMEGPFISPAKKGAQAESCISDPDIEMFRELQAASGNRIKLVDLAPERPHAMEFIKALSSDVILSIAHTESDYDTAMEAFRCGCNHVTHLYNAMPPFNHRKPGVVGAAMDAGAYVEVICDGMHIHGSVIRSIFKMFPEDKICLISDSMRCTGLPDGLSEIGGQKVIVKNGKCTLEDGTLAGSSTNLHAVLKKAVEFSVPLEKAIAALTANPARSIGVQDKAGFIRDGAPADCLLLDSELNLRAVFRDGIRFF